MSFFKRFIAAWREASTPDFVLDAEEPGFWTPADANALLSYWRSESGRKLKSILGNYQIKCAFSAVEGKMTTEHARGVRRTCFMLDQYLPQAGPETNEPDEISEGQKALEELGII